ncbi:MAG: isocitrate/isopropylmalate dehydrogenase family protein [Cyanobacteria bacterium NC_groundwater_1444_Ag_S-0.65um_54_12]|nr:isocitrate/isopropylmalate dehydrogenase family protein [Cyanobacteria bacterium NC_groundwater_1444_Ag_S-0.65um_54_12]
MSYRVTLIPGDGIGPEITAATVRCLAATGVRFDWEIFEAGSEFVNRTGRPDPLPGELLDAISRNHLALKGPLTTPIGTGFRSVNVALRQALDLFACVRPCKNYPGIPSRYQNIDIVIFRENTEDLYAGIEFQSGTEAFGEINGLVAGYNHRWLRHNSAVGIKPISEFSSRRIVRFAFDYAERLRRRKVSIIHKAEVMRLSDGLFLEAARQVARDYPEVQYSDLPIDNICDQLVREPEYFDILVLSNLFGDIISDLCAGLIGGLGVAPGANIGTRAVVFEPTHGSAPDIAGQDKANPTAQILCGVMLLRHLGEIAAGDRLENALKAVLQAGIHLTADIHPEKAKAVGTAAFADAVMAALF